ncbi:hypothetical protein ACHAQH_009746 [Verticillium albo-atrum]
MHFVTISIAALAMFAGLASAGIQARQGPGRPTCTPGQVICGAELRDILGRPVSQLENAIRAKGVTPNPARIDGIYRCTTVSSSTPDGIVWLAACFAEDGQTEAIGKCVPQFSQFPSNRDAFCRNGPATPASK